MSGLFTEEDFGATTVLSADGLYRYRWQRTIGAGPLLNFVMLNASTADQERMDPTVRRCLSFTRDHGFGGLVITNLFGYRSADPRQLGRVADPIGPDNDRHLREVARRAQQVVCAWGNGAGAYLPERATAVVALLREIQPQLWTLGVTQRGFPRHPLYVLGRTRFTQWQEGADA